MSKMFQISEEDLASMETVIPEIMLFCFDSCNDPVQRKRFEECKAILSNVRWGYGTPQIVERIQDV
jgi:hypothetical protein